MMVLSIDTISNKPEYRRTLIYGPPGSGKTTLAAEAPNPVWLDFENSTEALRKKFPSITIAGNSKELRVADNVLDFVLKADKLDNDTIVIDTVSSMYLTYMTEYMRQKFINKKKENKEIDRHIAYQPDFRKITNVMRETFIALTVVEKHVIIIAHEKYRRDQETGAIQEIRPSLPPAAEESIEQLVNECFYLEKKTNKLKGEVTRTLTVSSEGKIFAKNRQGFLVPTIENPTWKDIYK